MCRLIGIIPVSASLSLDWSVQVWDLRTGEEQFILHGHRAPGMSQRGCLDTCTVLISHCSMCVCFCLHVVFSVTLSPTGGMLATADFEWHMRFCAWLTHSHKTLTLMLMN